MKVETVPLRRIAWRNRRFVYTRGDHGDAALRESIRRSGLLAPPDLVRSGSSLVIIRGSRRLRALRALGCHRVEARIFEEGEISPLDAWEMNFFENLSLRPLNRAEACTAAAQLHSLGLPRERIVLGYFSRLGLPRRSRSFEDCLSVSSLPELCLDALAAGAVTLDAAVFLSTLGGKDFAAAFRFLSRRRLTFSQQREWVRLVADIAAREQEPVRSVLGAAVRSALRIAGGEAGVASAALQSLRERRYPALAARRRAFTDLLRRTRMAQEVSLSPHPTFERPEITVRFTARSAGGFVETLRRLEDLAGQAVLGKLLDAGDDEGR